MIVRSLLAAILAGILAGLFITPVQSFKTTPLILAAEVYEDGGGGHSHEHSALNLVTPAHAQEAEEEESTTLVASRLGGTALANVVLGAGFALILVAASLALNTPITARNGAIWGLAGFGVIALAPALGLPPELPAMPAGELEPRQMWWLMTVVLTGVGLAALVLAQPIWLRVLGLVAMLVPLFIPAPHPADMTSPIPPTLAAEFAVASLTTTALFWVLIGFFTGYVLEKLGAVREPKLA